MKEKPVYHIEDITGRGEKLFAFNQSRRMPLATATRCGTTWEVSVLPARYAADLNMLKWRVAYSESEAREFLAEMATELVEYLNKA